MTLGRISDTLLDRRQAIPVWPLSVIVAVALTGLPGAGLARSAQPTDILPPAATMPDGTAPAPMPAHPRRAPTAPPRQAAPDATGAYPPLDAAPGDGASSPVVQPLPLAPIGPTPVVEPVMPWTLSDARALLQVIMVADAEGLIPADYQPDALQRAIAGGPGPDLDAQASRSFDWLAEDRRDGRTPPEARLQWFAIDTDADNHPTATLLSTALASHDISGTLASLDPLAPDYAALRDALAASFDPRTRSLIRTNMDRWRWLPRNLGNIYLLTNVPEFQLRLMSNGRIIRTYRTIVGKPGRTATPQLAEKVQAVVFNPTWTVPQSIIQREGLGEKLIGNPAAARRQGYAVTQSGDGTISVVQQPGPGNSLGRMKIDMPNPHAIYLHDTPNHALFNAPVRAFSHGCIRTERAVELGMTMAILAKSLTPDEGVALYNAKKYKRVAMATSFPVYITYFTMARDITGQMATFNDLYSRDGAVVASFAGPRAPKLTHVVNTQEIIVAQDPL